MHKLVKVMRSFGWNPKDEEVKDMVNVIDQVCYSHTSYLSPISPIRYVETKLSYEDISDFYT